MKRISFLMLATIIFMTASKAQLANTKWKGVIFFPAKTTTDPMPVNVTWTFGKDTVRLSYDDQPEDRTDVMSYTLDSNTLSFRKISGSAPCDPAAVGKYRVVQLNDGEKLSITLLSDDCPARAEVGDLSKKQIFMKVR